MAKVRDVLRRNLILASIAALFVVGLVVSTAASGGFKPSLASSSCGYGYGYGCSTTTTTAPPSSPTTAPSTTTTTAPSTTTTTAPSTATKVYVTPPSAQNPGTVSVRVTTNQPNGVIHLFDEYAGASNYVQKAIHTAQPNSVGNGIWTFQINNVKATNHFYAVVNGVKSNTVAAVITTGRATPTTKVFVTPPAAQNPGMVSVRVTTNQPNGVIHLFERYAGASNYLQKAIHTAQPNSVGNGIWTFQINNMQATCHFFAIVNGVKSNTVAAPIN